jgi:hypothetical protein
MKESLAQRIANMNYMKETIAVRIDTYFNMMLSQQVRTSKKNVEPRVEPTISLAGIFLFFYFLFFLS